MIKTLGSIFTIGKKKSEWTVLTMVKAGKAGYDRRSLSDIIKLSWDNSSYAYALCIKGRVYLLQV